MRNHALRILAAACLILAVTPASAVTLGAVGHTRYDSGRFVAQYPLEGADSTDTADIIVQIAPPSYWGVIGLSYPTQARSWKVAVSAHDGQVVVELSGPRPSQAYAGQVVLQVATPSVNFISTASLILSPGVGSPAVAPSVKAHTHHRASPTITTKGIPIPVGDPIVVTPLAPETPAASVTDTASSTPGPQPPQPVAVKEHLQKILAMAASSAPTTAVAPAAATVAIAAPAADNPLLTLSVATGSSPQAAVPGITQAPPASTAITANLTPAAPPTSAAPAPTALPAASSHGSPWSADTNQIQLPVKNDKAKVNPVVIGVALVIGVFCLIYVLFFKRRQPKKNVEYIVRSPDEPLEDRPENLVAGGSSNR